MLQRNAVAYGNKPAIVSSGSQLDYRQLGREVMRLSHILRENGVKPGDQVGVVGARSAENIIVFLSLINMGAVYVPINDALPINRQRYMLDKASVGFVVFIQSVEKQRESLGYLGKLSYLQLALLDGVCQIRDSDNNLIDEAGYFPLLDADSFSYTIPSESGAYIIFTSGTTGNPKPVLVSRAAIMAHNHAVIERYQLLPEDRILHICANSFDISIEEILPTLAIGASLFIGPESDVLSGITLHDFLSKSAITVANLPTALWIQWCDACEFASLQMPASLKKIIIGGEACPPVRVVKWLERNINSIQCLNAYGPTETTITATAWEFSPVKGQYTPVGKPIGGVSCYILNRQLEPVAVDEKGELFIGGDLLALGYFQDARSTAQKFLPDPFSSMPGARMYCSGDLAYIDPCGEIVVTGRNDRQEKINGHRIELAEIEAQLYKLPMVKNAYLTVTQDDSIEKRKKLLGYLRLDQESEDYLSAPPGCGFYRRSEHQLLEQIDACLASNLPSYMRPDIYCIIDQIPLTANGKFDYQALPKFVEPGTFDETYPLNEQYFLGLPQRYIKDVIRSVFDCLGYRPANFSVSFIALGGDSITAMMLVSRLWAVGLVLDKKRLLGHEPLVAVLNNAVLREADNDILQPKTLDDRHLCINGISLFDVPESVLQDIQASLVTNEKNVWSGGSAAINFISRCSDAQVGMLYQSIMVPGSGTFIEQVEGRVDCLDEVNFVLAWQLVCERHEILRSAFSISLAEYIVHLVYENVDISAAEIISIESLENTPAHEQSNCIREFLHTDRRMGFALDGGPMFRVTLFKLDSKHYHFIWTYHHAILDGWSDVSILGEVFKIYDDLTQGKKSELPPAGRYRDYLMWMATQNLMEDAQFWAEYLKDSHSEKTLFAGSENKTNDINRKVCDLIVIDSEAANKFKNFIRQAGVTLNIGLAGIIAVVMAKHFNATEYIIGSVSSTRPETIDNIDRLAGPLINLLPMRVPVDANVAVVAWLNKLFDHYLSSERFVHVPYGTILKQLQRNVSNVFFDTLLVIENYPVSGSEQVKSLRSHTQTNYPLNFIAWPGEQFEIEVHYLPDMVEPHVAAELKANLLILLNMLPECKMLGDLIQTIAKPNYFQRKENLVELEL